MHILFGYPCYCLKKDKIWVEAMPTFHVNSREPFTERLALWQALYYQTFPAQGQSHKQYNSFAYRCISAIYDTCWVAIHNIFKTQTRANKSKPNINVSELVISSWFSEWNTLPFAFMLMLQTDGMISSGWTVRREEVTPCWETEIDQGEASSLVSQTLQSCSVIRYPVLIWDLEMIIFADETRPNATTPERIANANVWRDPDTMCQLWGKAG